MDSWQSLQMGENKIHPMKHLADTNLEEKLYYSPKRKKHKTGLCKSSLNQSRATAKGSFRGLTGIAVQMQPAKRLPASLPKAFFENSSYASTIDTIRG